MQQADIEREKQRANEELAGILTEMVIEPIDSRLEVRTREALFDFEGRLEDTLKKQFAAVGKTRNLESRFTNLDESLEDVANKLRLGFERLFQNLVDQSAVFQAGALEGQSELRQLLEQLNAVSEGAGQTSKKSFAKLAAQLEQHIAGLHERVSQLHAEFETLSKLSETSRQHLGSSVTAISKDIPALLEQSNKSVSGIRSMHESMEQQQLRLAAQQLEIQGLQQSLRRIFWPGLIIGLLTFGAVTSIALQTPIVAALLGFAN